MKRLEMLGFGTQLPIALQGLVLAQCANYHSHCVSEAGAYCVFASGERSFQTGLAAVQSSLPHRQPSSDQVQALL